MSTIQTALNYNASSLFTGYFVIGSLTAYLGSSDPTGWVICDGIARTNNSDGKYNALAAMGIGTGGTGTSSYTPPDLRGAFLRGDGKGTAAATLSTGYGSYAATLKSSQNDSMQTHTHGGTTDKGNGVLSAGSHNHYFQTNNDDWNCSALSGQVYGANYNCNDSPNLYDWGTTRMSGPLWNGDNDSGGTGVSDKGHAHSTASTSSNPSSGGAAETRPYNFSVNWIMRYM
jgi:microcystin-dependent protein